MKPMAAWDYRLRRSTESSILFCTEPKSEFHPSRRIIAATIVAPYLGITIIPAATGSNALVVMNNSSVATV